MATLTNTQISVTYVGLLKTSANTVLTSTAQQITDGDGNNSIMFLSTAGVGIGGSPASGKELDVTGNVQVTGDLQVDNINIDANTISATSGVVTLADGAIATTQSQNDNSTKIATTAYVDLAVDSVDTLAEVLAIGNTTGATKISVNNSSSGIDFVDDALLRLGTGNDLVIRHDASNSHIENATGTLNIEANNLRLGNYGTDNFIIATNAGSVELYHNDVKKFETTSTGVKVQSTGTATLTLLDADDSSEVSINHNASVTTLVYSDLIFDNGGGNNVLQLTSAINALENITLPDSKKIILGTGSDLQIYHDGSNSYIQDVGTGDLRITTSGGAVRINKGVSESIAAFIPDGAVELYYDNSKKFETTSAGVTITGAIAVNSGTTDTAATFTSSDASVAVNFVASDNSMQIATSSTDGILKNNGGGSLRFFNNGSERVRIDSSGNLGIGTTSPAYKIDISGSLRATGESTFTSNLLFPDSSRIKLGTGEDLQIYHDGSNSFISDQGTGALKILSNGVEIKNAGDSGFMAFFGATGASELYFNTSKKFETTSSGVTVSGTITANSDSDQILNLNSSDSNAVYLAFQRGGSRKAYIGYGGSGNTFNIVNEISDGDISIVGNDGGVTTPVLSFDVSDSGAATFAGNVSLADSKNLNIGTGNDLFFVHNGTNSFIQNANGDFYIEQASNDRDIIFRNDDGSGGLAEYFKLDGSDAVLRIHKRTIIDDSVKLDFGNGQDLQIYHDGSNSYVEQAGTGDLIIRNSADDKDIIFQSDDGSGGTTEYFRLNGDNSDVIFSKPIELEDSVELRIGGSGADLRFFHSTNSFMQNFVGDLQIEQHTNDKDIFLRCDDGSGGVTTYILLDGSEVATKIETVKIFMPNLPTSDPSVAGQLYNDSGTLKISAG